MSIKSVIDSVNAKAIKKKLSPFRIIILGFIGIILLGGLLLMLPWASRSGVSASFEDAIFTSTSAVCVTGLVVQDTATYWTVFGQIIILILIQIGGLGVMTAASVFTMIAGKKINLMQRSTMQEAIAAPQMGGIVKFTRFTVMVTAGIELVGFAVMAPVFTKEFGIGKGLWYSLFHSVSAFCNAGFDLMGAKEKFSSLTFFHSNPLIILVISALIIIGGLGFLTWDDIKTNKLKIKKYRMQSKVILSVTLVLIVLPTIYNFFFEFTSERWNMSLGDRLLNSFFQAVTPRTAGFNAVDFAHLSQCSVAITIILMLIGGSPGSTAGGMKTTTIAVLFGSAFSVFKKRDNTHFYGRCVPSNTISSASAILFIYLTFFLTAGITIAHIDAVPLSQALFETASAIGTVGLSLGITADLSLASHIILMLLMFIGRVGGLTLIYATLPRKNANLSKLPQEKITVG